MTRSGLLAAVCAAWSACAAMEIVSLNGTWEFRKGSDAAWRAVKVPHDWGIEGPFLIEPNGPEAFVPGRRFGSGFTGKLPWRGTGCYRRTFEVPKLCPGWTWRLAFDGVMANPKVSVNGHHAGGWDYGFASFRVDVTPFLKEGSNTVEVSCDTRAYHCHWYPGAGIYRDVWLEATGPNDPLPESVFIATPRISPKSATVSVAYFTAGGGPTNFTFEVDHPRLWSVDDPYLYSVEICGRKYRYGIRTAEFTSDDGFHLNGRRVQIKGACMHSDLGPLGMAFSRAAAKRQLLALRDMGVNAIRTAHNSPDPKLLDLCDEMGFLVWDEPVEKWDDLSGIAPDMDLEEVVSRNLRAAAIRDRNHPSVVIWSIGNEIRAASDDYPQGVTRARVEAFRNAITSADPTRPVSMAPTHGDLADTGALDCLDVLGWNYRRLYAPFHRTHPSIPVVCSESASALSSRGFYRLRRAQFKLDFAHEDTEVDGYDRCAGVWCDISDWEFERMAQDRYCAGEFIWTGFDYLGEPTPYARYHERQFAWLKDIPERRLSRSSYFGAIDLAGFPKDRFWLYRSQWNDKAVTVHILPHWNWKAGDRVPVCVYTSGDEVELFLNGHSLGRRRKATEAVPCDFDRASTSPHPPSGTNGYYAVCAKYRLEWDGVPWEPGELRAVAYGEGRRIGEETVRTVGTPVAVRLSADPYQPDEGDMLFVVAEVVDADGRPDPLSSARLEFSVKGEGEVISLCNGSQHDYETFSDAKSRRLHYGKLSAVVKRTGPGPLVLNASAPGLLPSTLRLGE